MNVLDFQQESLNQKFLPNSDISEPQMIQNYKFSFFHVKKKQKWWVSGKSGFG